MTRPLDHLVLPVRDLSKAAGVYEALGFTLTPTARHPWGTENRLVQFPGSFLELLAVADPEAIEEAAPGRFSFGAFNRDFLGRRGEGLSMLVLASDDEAADRAAFEQAGLPVYEPFRFERIARRPDGSARTVAFSLTFTSDPALAGVGFFTCRQHYPENFWNPAVQVHANAVTGIAAVTLAAADPSAHAAFLERLLDVAPASIPGGLRFDGPRGALEVVAVAAAAERFGGAIPTDIEEPAFVAIRFAVASSADVRRRAADAGLPVVETSDGIAVPAMAAFGTALVF